MLGLLGVLTVYMVWTYTRYSVDVFDIILSVGRLGLLVIWYALFFIVIRQAAIQALSTEVVLDTDSVRMMREDRVMVEIQFSDTIWMDIKLPEDGLVGEIEGFRFGRGFLNIHFAVSREDTARMWPVVEAAAWKHRMRSGGDWIDEDVLEDAIRTGEEMDGVLAAFGEEVLATLHLQVDGGLPGESGRHYMRAMDLPEEGDVDDTLGRFTADRPRTGWQWSLLARGIPTARER